MANASAAELIKQFREGKPTSRADREAMRSDGRRPESLWWSQGQEGNSNSFSDGKGSKIQRPKQYSGGNPDIYNDPGEDSYEGSGGVEPRTSSTLKNPEPRIGSTINKQERVSRRRTPMERLQRYEALNPHNKPKDYMAEEAARSLMTHDDVDVDEMIAAQIREMESEIKSEYRHTETEHVARAGKGEDGSMAFGHGSLDLSKSFEGFEKKTTLRDSLRSSLGLSLGGAKSSEPTIEGTGLKGLLMVDYRLGASSDNVGEAFNTIHDRGLSPSRGSNDGHLKGVNVVNEDMEELLKVLHNDENFQSGKQNDIHVASIGQVADMLDLEMTGFLKVVDEREYATNSGSAQGEKRDEELREQGRAEARAKNLFGSSHSCAADVVRTAVGKAANQADAGLGVRDDAAAVPEARSRVDEVAALDAILGSQSFVHDSTENAPSKAPDLEGAPASAGCPLPPRYPMLSPPVTTPSSFAAAVGPSSGDAAKAIGSLDRESLNRALMAGWHPVQAAIDKEMSAADEILFRMRSLRTGLSSRLRHLDALSASIMSPTTGNVGLPRADDSVKAPPMLRSSREHWNGISRISETAKTQTRDKILSANVAPWGNKDQVVTDRDLTHAANTLASTGKEIQTNLDQSLNRLLTVLMDSSAPTPAPSVTRPESNVAKAPEPSQAPVTETEEKARHEGDSVPKPKDGGCGPTLRELNAPLPPKSLLAEIDDIGNTLGRSISVESRYSASSEVQAVVGAGFDKFIPQSSRENPFIQSAQGPSSPPEAAPALRGKRKTLSPSPFRTTETVVPPKLYAVPAVRDDNYPHQDSNSKVRIVAPSDEDLLLRERLNIGAACGDPGTSPLATIASAPAWIPKIPTPSSSFTFSAKYPGAPTLSPEELPWASEGGTVSSLRTRPLEGLAIMSMREDAAERRKKETSELQTPFNEKETKSELLQSSVSLPRSLETGRAAPFMEREKHLESMRSMRFNLASIL